MNLLIVVTPDFNMSATLNFIDPLRVANYLDGIAYFDWTLVSVAGGSCTASNGLSIDTERLAELTQATWDFVIVSSSWAPESHCVPTLLSALKRFSKQRCTLGALDTGAFVLAKAGLLNARSVTVHYEHIDAFRELYPKTEVLEDLFVFSPGIVSCCGGAASIDFGLHFVRSVHGEVLANRAARYLYQERLRPAGSRQQPESQEPLGRTVPVAVKEAINVMENHLEDVLPIPELCKQVKVSQRHLDRLFSLHVKKTPASYYRDIRLDRARGLITQTDLSLTDVCVASGFLSTVHFSRAYKRRFGLSPTQDRIEGRIPFEYRAKPLHKKRH